MRRTMNRRLLNLVTAVSLVLCVAVVALWVGSYFRSDLVTCEEPGESPFVIHQVWVTRGRVCVVEDVRGMRDEEIDADATFVVPTRRRWSWDVRPPKAVEPFPGRRLSPLNRAGFFKDFGDAHGVRWVFPLGALLVPALALPLGRFLVVWANRRRGGAGLCRRCGYDLTGNVSGVCPECGGGQLAQAGATNRGW
jgi:hypothetical protein